MAKDIRGEFEEYIEELVTEISRKIFLEDLKEICEKYQKQLFQYEQLIAKAEGAAEKMDEFTETEEANIRGLSQNVNYELTQVNQTVQQLTEDYTRIFHEFSEKVNLLNQNERKAFIDTLDKKIAEYEAVMVKRLDKEYESLFTQLFQDFEKICAENNLQYKDFQELVETAREAYAAIVKQQESSLLQMQQVDDTIDSNLQSISAQIGELNNCYEEVFHQFSRKVSSLNEKERALFIEEVQQVLNGYRNTFADEIAVKYVSISDKFRTDLGGIYKEYENQLAEYRSLLQEVQRNNRTIQQFTMQNIPELQKLSKTVDVNLQNVNYTISGITQKCMAVFGEFSDRVTALNETERQKLLTGITESISRQLTVMQEVAGKTQRDWEEKAKELTQQMSNSLKEQQEGYQYDRKMFLQDVGQQMTDFKHNIADEIRTQQELIGKLTEEHRELEELQRELHQTKNRMDSNEEAFHMYIQKQETEISQLLEKVQQTQQKIENDRLEVWNQMLSEWKKREKSLDKQRDFAAWKFFMMTTNTLLVFLLSILVFLQKPWGVLGKQETIMLVIIFVIFVLLIVFRKFLTGIFMKNKNGKEDSE